MEEISLKNLGPNLTVSDNGGATATQMDKHRDPSHPPKITTAYAGVTIEFDKDPPNANYKEIDGAIKLKITVNTNISLNTVLGHIEFGSEYLDRNGLPLPPQGFAAEESIGNIPLWRPINLTSKGFQIFADFAQTAPVVLRLRYAFLPSG